MSGKKTKSLEQRFWAKVDKRGPDDCWEWTGSRMKRYAHGQIRIDGKAELVHRVSWILTHGEIPAGLCVCHRCDNPPCCNPRHLFLGTQKDNWDDCIAKGRAVFTWLEHPEIVSGEKNTNAKLTAAIVREIRRLYSTSTANQHQLARAYGVTRPNIASIVRRKTWRNVA
jgi:predicted XRE-type DNA-binding protein